MATSVLPRPTPPHLLGRLTCACLGAVLLLLGGGMVLTLLLLPFGLPLALFGLALLGAGHASGERDSLAP
jgi:hypothetical protein